MANFNEKINSHKELVLRDREYDYSIKRIGSMTLLKLEFGYNVKYLKSGYRLFIRYKDTHRVKKVAGRCFMWDCPLGTSNRVEVRRLGGEEDCDGLVVPRFDGMASAIFITEKHVYMYGDARLVAMDSKSGGEYILCNTYLCGLLAGQVKILAKMFY